VADPRIRMIREGVSPTWTRRQAQHRRHDNGSHYRGCVGPRIPWNGVHVKMLGAMSSR
jgi:hypothetical protein